MSSTTITLCSHNSKHVLSSEVKRSLRNLPKKRQRPKLRQRKKKRRSKRLVKKLLLKLRRKRLPSLRKNLFQLKTCSASKLFSKNKRLKSRT